MGPRCRTLVHGGPGRAGDGEELGGIRGMKHFMQRTAIQGSPRAVSAVTGTWVTGAPRTTDGVHPFRKSLAELRIGDAVVAGPRVITLDDIEAFAALSGDTFYAHMDAAGRRGQPVLRGPGRPRLLRGVHGRRPVRVPRAGTGAGQLRPAEPAFTTPVYPGDALTVALTAKASRPGSTPTTARSSGMPLITNQNGDTVSHLRRAHPGCQDLAAPSERDRRRGPRHPAVARPTRRTPWKTAPDRQSLDAIERASVDELRALQLQRLQWSLRHAYENVPHYRAAFDAAGVHPDDCRDLADLAKFPPPARPTCGPTTRSACSRCPASGSPASTPRPAPPASRPSSATPSGDVRHVGIGDGPLHPGGRRPTRRPGPYRLRLRAFHRWPGCPLRRREARLRGDPGLRRDDRTPGRR